MAKNTGGRATKIELPSNLSFRRSIEVSEGELFSVLPDGGKKDILKPVHVVQTTVRGAMAAYVSGYAKGGAALTGESLVKAQNPASPNIQSIDRANLDANSETLAVKFSVAFHAASLKPDACSSAAYVAVLDDFHLAARDAGLHRDLAARYLWNLANGRVGWRNSDCGIAQTVTVEYDDGKKTVVFSCDKLPTRSFPGDDALVAAASGHGTAVTTLIAEIAGALAGTGPRLLALNLDLRIRLYKGAEVWPSQEFAERSQKVRDGREISRILSSRLIKKTDDELAYRHATMHSQKIGNAIRTIDEWHDADDYGAIPVEAFGWVQRDLVAIRRPEDRADSYAAFSDVAQTTRELIAGRARGTALYTLAMIIRGGVYGIGKGGDETNVEAAAEVAVEMVA